MTANDMKFSFQLKFDSLFEFSSPAYDDRQISYLLTEAEHRVFFKRYNPLGNRYQKGFEADEQRRRDLEQLIKPATVDGKIQTGGGTYSCTWNTSGTLTAVYIASPGSTKGLNPGQVITGTGIGTDNKNIIKDIIDDNNFTLEVMASTPTQLTPVTLYGGLGKSPAQGGVHPNGVFLDMPSDFLYAIEEAVKLETNPGAVLNTTESWIKPVKHDEYLPNINNPYKKPYKDLVWRMDVSRTQHAIGTETIASPKRTELVLPSGYVVNKYRFRYLALPPAIVVDEFTPANQKHCILDESLHKEIVDEAVIIAQAAVKPDKYQIGVAEQERND